MKSDKIKHYVFLVLIYIILFGLKWSTFPSYIDEYNTILLSNGLPVHIQAIVNDKDLVVFKNISSEEIRRNNTLPSVMKFTLKDGGNAPVYYLISHFISITLGKYLGILNSLRLLSNLFSITLIMFFYSFISRKFGKSIAIKCSLLLIFLIIQFGDYIRTYPLSGFFTFVFYIEGFRIIEKILNNEEISKKNYVVLIVTSILIPFFHHFNVLFLIFFSIIIILIHMYFNIRFQKLSSLYLIIGLSLALFSFYYLYNSEGREFQANLSNYWHQYALNYNKSENNWLYPANLKYLIFENNENLLFISGLNMRMAFPYLRMIYFSILLSIPLFIILRTLRNLKIKHLDYLLILSILFIIYYLVILNLICVLSGHVIALNSSWYSYTLLPIYCCIISGSLKHIKKKNIIDMILVNAMIVIIGIKTLLYLYNLKNEEIILSSTSPERTLIQKIENQFK